MMNTMESLQVGEKIRFLDSVGGGTVVRIDEKKRLAYVEDEDGFELPVPLSQCVPIRSDFKVQPQSQTRGEVQVMQATTPKAVEKQAHTPSVKLEEAPKLPSYLLNKRKKEAVRPLEIDLHAQQLLDSTAGLAPRDILLYQLKVVRDTMQQQLPHKGQKVVFIHGKGAGVLRQEVDKLLRKEFPKCEIQDASFQEYGFGATQVTIR